MDVFGLQATGYSLQARLAQASKHRPRLERAGWRLAGDRPN